MVHKSDKRHKQVLARISPTETTYIDIKLKDLIELLNTFDGIETWESCQDIGDGWAEICMDYHNDDIFTFASKLATVFAEKVESSHIIVSPELLTKLNIVWDEDKKEPWLLLTIPTRHIRRITNVISQARHLFVSHTSYIQP
jgi:hypothetical protein